VAKTASGIKIATSKIAISEKPVWFIDVPPNSYCEVSEDEFRSNVLWEDESRYDFTTPPGIDSHVINYIRDNPGSNWWKIATEAVGIHFPTGKANLSVMKAFSVIEDLLASGEIDSRIAEVRGVDNQIAPEMRFYL
jgi:hypothetical protein